MTLHERLLQLWRTDADFQRDDKPAQVAVTELEARYGVSLPPDFRAHLEHVAPTEAFFDDNAVNWWPVNDIKNIPDEYPHEIKNPEVAGNAGKYLFFADYLIWLWAWAICCDPNDANFGRIVRIDGQDDFFSDDFEQFLELAVNDQDVLAGFRDVTDQRQKEDGSSA